MRAFGIGLGAGLLVVAATVAGALISERMAPKPAAPSPGASALSGAALTAQPDPTKERLRAWQAAAARPEDIRPQILDAAIAYFARQTPVDEAKLRQQVVTLAADDYGSKSASYCEDAADVRSTSEAWLLDIRGDTLYVNDGFIPASKQSVVDLFFRYLIGLYNVAPELKSYPNGVKSSDGTTAYFEKGLILLGQRNTDQLLNASCYLPYRRPIQEGYTADRALKLLARLDLAPSPEYDFPQKASLERFRSSVVPKLGSAVDELLEPFLKTESGEFYRRAGRALGGDAATADRLFRATFPPA